MSRFEDTLQRDLAVIADRATPSPDAWQQILVRIADQEPIEETEIIMLVENQERPRRWPAYAAAAAVVALVAGGIALIAAQDDGESPADDPTPVTTPAPENVDEQGTSVDDEDGADAALRTVTLSGEALLTVENEPGDDPYNGTFTGRAVLTGPGVDLDMASSGSFTAESEAIVDGDSVAVLTGSIVGIGDGSITSEGPWSRRDGFDVTEDAPITDSTGAFEGASGTFSIITEAESGASTWSMTLTLPADRFGDDFVEGATDAVPPAVVDEVVPAEALPPSGRVLEGRYTTDYIGTDLTFEVTTAADISWTTLQWPGTIWLYTGSGDEFVQMTRISGWYDADQAVDPGVVGFGNIAPDDIDGLIAARPDMLIDDLGETEVGGRTARWFESSLDPTSTAGEGICDPSDQPCTWLTSRSGDAVEPDAYRATPSLLGRRLVRSFVIDMDGYEPILVEGWTTRDDKEAWLDEVFQPIVDSIELGEPTYAVEGGRASLTTSVVATGTWTDADYLQTPRDDGSFDVTYVSTYAGDVRGDAPSISYWTPVDGGNVGGGTLEFTGEIDGLGTGTLTIREESVTLPTFLSVAVITGGTGDFEGASGWALFDPNSKAGTYEMHIEVPARPSAAAATRNVVVESQFAVVDVVQTAAAGATLISGSTEFTGGLEGTAPTNARIVGEPVGTARAFGTRWIEATVEGVGTGTMLLQGPFRFDEAGNYIGLANVVAASGDLTGVTGTVRFQSADRGASGTATFDLQIPTG